MLTDFYAYRLTALPSYRLTSRRLIEKRSHWCQHLIEGREGTALDLEDASERHIVLVRHRCTIRPRDRCGRAIGRDRREGIAVDSHVDSTAGLSELARHGDGPVGTTHREIDVDRAVRQGHVGHAYRQIDCYLSGRHRQSVGQRQACRDGNGG